MWTVERRLASPMGPGFHLGFPSMEKLRPSLPDLLFSFFLVISDLTPPLEAGLWGGDGSCSVAAQPLPS